MPLDASRIQSAEDGRNAEDLPGAHPFRALGAGCTARRICTWGALDVGVGVHHLQSHPGAHELFS